MKRLLAVLLLTALTLAVVLLILLALVLTAILALIVAVLHDIHPLSRGYRGYFGQQRPKIYRGCKKISESECGRAFSLFIGHGTFSAFYCQARVKFGLPVFIVFF